MTLIVEIQPDEYDGTHARTLLELADACAAADHASPLDEDAVLHIRHHGLTASRLWMHDHGFALLRHAEPTGSGEIHSRLELAVDPAARGQGIGGALLAAALRANPADGSLGWECRAWSHADLPAAAALAQRNDFRRVRELHELSRTLPLNPTGPKDPRVRAWRTGDEASLLRVNAAAFADHPEQGDLSAHHLALRMAEPWFSPAGLLVAEDKAGEMLGFHWTKIQPGASGPGTTGEVYVLGVAPWAQGQGVGRALLEAGLDHLSSQGCTDVALFVDASNQTALELYTKSGFNISRTHAQYLRTAPAARG